GPANNVPARMAATPPQSAALRKTKTHRLAICLVILSSVSFGAAIRLLQFPWTDLAQRRCTAQTHIAAGILPLQFLELTPRPVYRRVCRGGTQDYQSAGERCAG